MSLWENQFQLIYVLTWNASNWRIQYVGQHCYKIRHNYSKIKDFYINTSNILVTIWGKNLHSITGHQEHLKLEQDLFRSIYGFRTSKIQTLNPFDSNDNIYQEGNISKFPAFDIFHCLKNEKLTKQRKRKSIKKK